MDLYKADLPVFISTDAILHAFHQSYDDILKSVEVNFLIDKLSAFLSDLKNELLLLKNKYQQNAVMLDAIRDLDFYLSVPQVLLKVDYEVLFPGTSSRIASIMQKIISEEADEIQLFTGQCKRKYDFSQFTSRGHYTDSEALTNYFKAMIWLGRTEIYLTEPSEPNKSCTEEERMESVRRQMLMSFMMYEMMQNTSIRQKYDELEKVISAFVGEQDNVTVENLEDLFSQSIIDEASDLLDDDKVEAFRDFLCTRPYARQMILSQILLAGGKGEVEPAIAFMLLGQRFVVDSYVTGQVVYDRIQYQGNEPCRLYPSTLDIMFTLGNNSTTHLLIEELETYHYASNLGGLRDLVSNYSYEFWNTSIYNAWLHAIQTLSPEPTLSGLPEFMKTGAWGLEKLNTQLSSWTELRHDNILYVKQSYTGVGQCSYPEGYVEPVPDFFRTMQELCYVSSKKLEEIPAERGNEDEKIKNYFDHFARVCKTLEEIASKELNGKLPDEEDMAFINGLCSDTAGCGSGGGYYMGWYTDLFYRWYGMDEYDTNPGDRDLLVVDYHTTPSDCAGTIIGDVSHAGTGNPDLIVTTVQMPDGNYQAFAGPVMSYHEYITHDFERLTDGEWSGSFLELSLRPEWTKVYLADNAGNSGTSDMKLYSSVEALNVRLGTELNLVYDTTNYYWYTSDKSGDLYGITHEEAGYSTLIYPNPVKQSMLIAIKVNHQKQNESYRIEIFNLGGQLIEVICDEILIPGNHLYRWERKGLPAGMYLLRTIGGDHESTERFILCD